MKTARQKSDARPTVERLCADHQNEEPHARQVAHLAAQIFDAVQQPLNLKKRDRLLLLTAAQLHDIGYAADPGNHVAAGVELVRRTGLRGFSDNQVDEITAIMALHGRLPDERLAGPLLERSPRPNRIFQLAAILRVADALDHSHLQDSRILRISVADGMIRVRVSTPRDSANAERAMAKSDLWQRVFGMGLVVEAVRRGFAGRPRARDPSRIAIRRLLLAHYPVVRTTVRRAARVDDEEALHDLRIALRSLRRILEAFARPLRKTSAAECEALLRDWTKRLGPTRDLDVWVSLLNRPRFQSALAGSPAFLASQLALRDQARAVLRAELNDSSTQLLLQRLGYLLRIELAQASASGGKPFGRLARRQLYRAWKALWKKRHWARSRKSATLHALRIRLRKLRMLAALTAPAVGPEGAWLAATLHDVERNLGRIHDLDEALMRASRMPDAPPALLPALARRRRKEVRAFRERWACLETPTFRQRCRSIWRMFRSSNS